MLRACRQLDMLAHGIARKVRSKQEFGYTSSLRALGFFYFHFTNSPAAQAQVAARPGHILRRTHCTTATQHAPYLGWQSSPRLPHERIPWTNHLGRHPTQGTIDAATVGLKNVQSLVAAFGTTPQQNIPKVPRMP
jgi:hypothetical protein